MPSPNIVRQDETGGIYHVYSRGVNKLPVLQTVEDKERFISYLIRYLSPIAHKNKSGGYYANFYEGITLHAFAIMDNHFHLLITQHQQGQLSQFMKCLLCAYASYSNDVRAWIGPAFQSRYKARLVADESYWLYISKYIHRNPANHKSYEHSSYKYYLQRDFPPRWLNTQTVISAFGSSSKYIEFVDTNPLGSDPGGVGGVAIG